jgi:RimJ/RimL family protein N-acetyltransferase
MQRHTVAIAETSRLIIRQLTINDAEFVLTLTNEPSSIESIGDKGLRSVANAERFKSEGPWTSQQKPGFGQFSIVLKKSGDLIGVCGLLYRVNLNSTDVDLRYYLNIGARGLRLKRRRL